MEVRMKAVVSRTGRTPRLLVPLAAAGLLALAWVGSASAEMNCIGQFASSAEPGTHGQSTSTEAKAFGGLGQVLGVVAPACSGR